MSFIDISDLADASSFRRRLVPAVAKVAGQVMSETPSGKVTLDRKRSDLAREALRNPVDVSERFVWSVLSNVTIAAAGLDSTDGDLEYQVNQSWSTIAGVTAADEAEEPVVGP